MIPIRSVGGDFCLSWLLFTFAMAHNEADGEPLPHLLSSLGSTLAIRILSSAIRWGVG